VRPSNVTWLAWPRSWLPNKRLKLTGGDRFKGNGVLCAGAHELSFNDGALRASRPQLKRDPLGSATDSLNDEAPIRSSRPHHLHDRAGFRVRAGYATSRSVGLRRRHWGLLGTDEGTRPLSDHCLERGLGARSIQVAR